MGITVTFVAILELMREGLYSGTASVDDKGVVTYTSTEDTAYRDLVKILVHDEDGSSRLVFLTVNKNKKYQDNAHPVISDLEPTPTPKPTPKPTPTPTPTPTEAPTEAPTTAPTTAPTEAPIEE